MNINLSLQLLRMSTRGPSGTILATSLMMVVIVFKFISMDAMCMLHKSFESLYHKKKIYVQITQDFTQKGLTLPKVCGKICCIHESESDKLESSSIF